MPQYYGWDVGGAHLKLAVLDDDGALIAVRQVACALWQGEDRLIDALQRLAQQFSFEHGRHALTMTGELCDLFEHREQGVTRIIERMVSTVRDAPLMVYAGSRGWLAPSAAVATAAAVASQNWHATASWCARRAPDAMVIDIGSTTTDIIALQHGQVVCAETDAARLETGELLYAGVSRTPVMAVIKEVPMNGRWRAVTAETFATMADVYRITGELPDGADKHATADGRPADRPHSLRRLARMVGEDADLGNERALADCARFVAFSHFNQLQRGFSQVVSQYTRPEKIVGVGSGEFLVRRLANFNEVIFQSFAELVHAPSALSSDVSTCAPAVAVAKLAHWKRL
ncbi:MAG: S-layer protein [Gammaproteobacteria bacterium]|nr:S-layer protein [Gammaproteobacteria bacterium]